MDIETNEQIKKLADDNIHGANWLSIQAMNILQMAISNSRVQTVSELLDSMDLLVKTIIETHPNMISIINNVAQFSEYLYLTSQGQHNLEKLKHEAIHEVSKQIIKIKTAALKAAMNGANIVENNDTIISCSYSSTLCKVIELLKQRALKFNLIILESKFQNKAYGRICAEQLERFSVQSRLVSDKDIPYHIYHCDKVMVGVDTILYDGSLINGYPSYELAVFASKAGVPLYAICETAKLDIHNRNKNQIRNIPGFDIVPAKLISKIITEDRMIEPTDIAKL